jgi:hypothetical protein|tara:strand:- start:2629 stop:4092 length:1464 start_codon:yes stop_codon:yes gene_type:complete
MPESNASLDERVIELKSGYRLGPLGRLFPFSDLGYSRSEIAFIENAESNSSVIQRGKSRWMGGVYVDHPHDMIRAHLDISPEVAERYGVDVDDTLIHNLGLIVALIWHDVEEDYQPINDLRRELWTIRQPGRDYSPEADRLRGLIIEERGKLVHILERESAAHIERLIGRYSISMVERDRLFKEAAIGLGVADWLTRHVEVIYYLGSMDRMHQRYTGSKILGGGPYQERVMEILEVGSNQLEPLDYFWMRVYGRALDRKVLSRERHPRFSADEAEELEQKFGEDPWFVKNYGEDIRFSAGEMPRPNKLNLVYRNSIVLHHLDSAVNEYGHATFVARNRNPRAYAFLLASLTARDYIIEGSLAILKELRLDYKTELMDGDRYGIQDELKLIEERRPEHLDVVTGRGPISRGTDNDTVYKDRWERLDNTYGGKLDNYRDVLVFERLYRNHFLNPEENKVDLNRGTFSLFKIGGIVGGNLVPAEFRPIPS